MNHLHFFLGVDPAPSEGERSDDGGLVGAMAYPKVLLNPVAAPPPGEEVRITDNPADWRFDLIYGARFTWKEKLSATQWAGAIHGLHQRFGFDGIGMDPQQGGYLIQRELIKPVQMIEGYPREVTPIADRHTGPGLVARGHFILHMLRPGDDGVRRVFMGSPAKSGVHNDNLYGEMRMALDNGMISMPPKRGATTGGGLRPHGGREGEEIYRTMALLCEQLTAVEYETNADGSPKLSGQGSRLWFSKKKKDLVTAAINALMAFRIWLRLGSMHHRTREERVASLTWSGGGPPHPGAEYAAMAEAGGAEAWRGIGG